MEKINFVNNTTPALNATNLNKLQDNVEDAISELETEQNTKIKTTQTTSDTDTYSCNYINTLHTYSTDEVVIGTYGGKPLYRKIYETTTSIPGGGGYTSITIPHGLSNVDKIWVDNSVSRIETTGSSYTSYSLPLIGYEGNTTDKIYTKVDSTNITIYGNGWGTSWRKIVGVLYTKTND